MDRAMEMKSDLPGILMERDAVRKLCARFSLDCAEKKSVLIGPGDDAAVLDISGTATVVSTDTLTEGVDFLLKDVSPEIIGRKALAANLSDIAAMAARPTACVISVVLPHEAYYEGRLHTAGELLDALCDGFQPLADAYHCPVVGGDTNTWNGGLVISVTVLGESLPRGETCHGTPSGGPLCRSGARAGDVILVTGVLGGSILEHQFSFKPRIEEALKLHRLFSLHAGMDISDGLLLDISRLVESSGCGAVLNYEAIPISADAYRLTEYGKQMALGLEIPHPACAWITPQFALRTPLEHALGDGEDYELLLVAPAAEAERILRYEELGVPISKIGEICSAPGLWNTADELLPSLGWEH